MVPRDQYAGAEFILLAPANPLTWLTLRGLEALQVNLDGDHERGFANRSTSALTFEARAADLGIVDLDSFIEPIDGFFAFAFKHHLRQFLLNLSRRHLHHADALSPL